MNSLRDLCMSGHTRMGYVWEVFRILGSFTSSTSKDIIVIPTTHCFFSSYYGVVLPTFSIISLSLDDI